MPNSLATKCLLPTANRANAKGFTLIELLVVIIIIGILAAIALPSFLNQASRARESEGKTNIGAINRAQQAYLAEFGRFAGRNSEASNNPACLELCVLEVGIGDDSSGTVTTDYYEYYLDSQFTEPVAKATADPTTANIANPDTEIKGFLGCVNKQGEAEIVEGNRSSAGGARTPQNCVDVTS
ncbi:MAG: prepilin-type N-terminal cleavage/methylation domain-containing protein [Cyanobacteria bacterium J06636_16]